MRLPDCPVRISTRLYLPILDEEKRKLSVLVYFHAGVFKGKTSSGWNERLRKKICGGRAFGWDWFLLSLLRLRHALWRRGIFNGRRPDGFSSLLLPCSSTAVAITSDSTPSSSRSVDLGPIQVMFVFSISQTNWWLFVFSLRPVWRKR
ncbi:unnamed protein product [Linum trigynum]|uniref:Uncharacterized protein n=1 Tax=Linum trigynum TaxID=586398 RepID=A0AAV2E051_9ROSI